MTVPMRIDLITVGERARKDMGDLQSLAESMNKIGLLQPVGVSSGGELVYGQRRLEAARSLGWETIDVVIIDMTNPLLGLIAERDENEERKGFSTSERVAIARRIQDKQLALNRMRRSAPKGFGGVWTDGDTLAPSGRARDAAASAVGLSPMTYDRARKVVEAAEADPSKQPLVDAMDRGEMPVLTAFKMVTATPRDSNIITKPIGAQKRTGKTAEARLRVIADQLETYAEALPRMDTREEDLEDVLGAITRNARAVANAANKMRRNTA